MNLADLASAKIAAVQKITDFLDNQSCDIVEIPSPPFADNHGPNHLFESTTEVVPERDEDFDSVLKNASAEFSLNLSKEEIAESERLTDVGISECYRRLGVFAHGNEEIGRSSQVA